MKKTFIAIAAIIITSASIFWACSKDSETEEVKNSTSNIKEKCTEFQEQLGEDATIIGFASFDNPEEIFYIFNFNELVENFHCFYMQEMGMDIILENIYVSDDEPCNPILQPGLVFSIIAPESEEGTSATMLIPIEKFIDNGIIIYYAREGDNGNTNGGTNGGINGGSNIIYKCINKNCTNSCVLNKKYDEKTGNLSAVWCGCTGTGVCDLDTTKDSWWDKLCGSIGKWFSITININ